METEAVETVTSLEEDNHLRLDLVLRVLPLAERPPDFGSGTSEPSVFICSLFSSSEPKKFRITRVA